MSLKVGGLPLGPLALSWAAGLVVAVLLQLLSAVIAFALVLPAMLHGGRTAAAVAVYAAVYMAVLTAVGTTGTSLGVWAARRSRARATRGHQWAVVALPPLVLVAVAMLVWWTG